MKHQVLQQFSITEKLPFADFYLNDRANVILVKYRKGVVIDLEKAKQVVKLVYPLILNGGVYGITDATSSFLNITKEARAYYRSNKSINLSKAHAVVVKELYVRMLVKLFIKFDKPVVPTKIFNDFHKAYHYLLSYDQEGIEVNSSKVPSE